MRPALLCLGLLAAGLFGPLVAADRPPNIIFVLADDLGWTDVGCFGSKYYETPNLDRLASQGMRLTNHHHCQNCAPTRSALLSGHTAPARAPTPSARSSASTGRPARSGRSTT